MRLSVFTRDGFGRQSAFLWALLVGSLALVGPLTRPAWGQQERSVPSFRYHAAFSDFYDGEYRDALREFLAEGRGSIKIGLMRWIDTICYETMIGECYYQMGLLNEALPHYTAALELYAAYPDWMIRVQFPAMIRPAAAGAHKPIPWGVSTRRSRLGHYPTSIPIMQGRINNNDQVRRGGIVQQAYLRPIEVQEIVRCTTLAIRRRAKLMGPVCAHDPLFADLIAKLMRRPGRPNHWSEAWIDIQLGLALIAGGKEAQGLPHLQRAVVAAGEFDHPLTSIALLELGRLFLARADYPKAASFFEEATYAAVNYPNPGVLEEAFRYGALTHLVANRPGIYPPLLSGIHWAKVKQYRHLHASLLLLAAENHAVLGGTREAASLLDDARMTIGRRQMGTGWIGARLRFLGALVLFQQRKVAEGNAMLASAMEYMRHGSHWLFQISLADNLYTGGTVPPRVAMDLYSNVLRDPQPDDWGSDPMEAFSVLLTPHPLPIEHWFEVALNRKEHEKALEISDRARRHRFFSSLAFGGRLQSLRWILEGPDEALDQQDQLHRQDLLARYPAYAALARQAAALRTKLGAMPLVAEDPEALRRQSEDLGQLAALSMQQEAILREMALRREPAKLIFPPLRSVQEIQKSLPPGHAILAFFATGRHLYAFLLNNERYTYWQVGSPATLTRRIVGLLREMGHFQQNGELALKDLADPKWKTSAREILDMILKDSQADFTQNFDELVIVPDGVLWYLPFEALQVNIDGKPRPLISRFRIRYVPTVSLATSSGRGRNPTGNTAVAVGRLFPRDDDAVARAAFEKLADVLPGTVALNSPAPSPSSIYATMFDRLIVLDDLNVAELGPYDWAPLPEGAGKAGNALGDWIWLPWGGPDEIILPGFHTAAEESLKRINKATAGNEVFLSVCGLMSSGSRTLLLSRWRTGGQTCFDLVREFAQELPHTTPSDAWQRAVFLAAGSRLDVGAEPRIKRTVNDEVPKATHPFFWSGYMLVDTGTAPKKAEPPPVDPVVKVNKPGAAGAKIE